MAHRTKQKTNTSTLNTIQRVKLEKQEPYKTLGKLRCSERVNRFRLINAP